MSNAGNGIVEQILQRLGELKFKNLFLVVAALLVVDLVVPDFIPLIDEILLGLLTMLFWSWRKPQTSGKIIDAEKVD